MSFSIDFEGIVYSCGNNKNEQLGLGDNKNIPNLPPIKYVAYGVEPTLYEDIIFADHALFVDFEGIVYSCGVNKNGQLGLGDIIKKNIPSKILNLPPIKYVACGTFHTLFVDFEGIVYSCGSNNNGQLGLGDNDYRNIPSKILNLPKDKFTPGRILLPPIKYISCGYYHTLFVDIEGIVYSCGDNYCGQLGLGDNINRNIPSKILNLPPIKYVAGGTYHTIFVDYEGIVYSCGSNFYGQLGLGHNKNINIPSKIENLQPIKYIACGGENTVFVDFEGIVYTCGSNINRNIPSKILNLPPIDNLGNPGEIPIYYKSARDAI